MRGGVDFNLAQLKQKRQEQLPDLEAPGSDPAETLTTEYPTTTPIIYDYGFLLMGIPKLPLVNLVLLPLSLTITTLLLMGILKLPPALLKFPPSLKITHLLLWELPKLVLPFPLPLPLVKLVLLPLSLMITTLLLMGILKLPPALLKFPPSLKITHLLLWELPKLVLPFPLPLPLVKLVLLPLSLTITTLLLMGILKLPPALLNFPLSLKITHLTLLGLPKLLILRILVLLLLELLLLVVKAVLVVRQIHMKARLHILPVEEVAESTLALEEPLLVPSTFLNCRDRRN